MISGGSGWFGTNDVEHYHYHYHAPADALAKRVNFGPLARVIIPTVEQDPTDELIAAMQGVLQSNDLDAWAPVAIGLYNISTCHQTIALTLESPRMELLANMIRSEGIYKK